MKQIFITGLIFLSFLSFSQKVQVRDSDRHMPIPHVYVYSGCSSGMTNDDGIIDLSDFCKDTIVVFQHASYVDYAFQSQTTSKDTILTIYMVNDIFNLNEVVVSASKWDEGSRQVSRVIQKIKAKDIALYNPQTSADLLSVNSKVFVQKSQLGGGSPMIRGFSANRVLLVMDGVRMNNAIYRSGNLQNVLNIDANAIESTEVILGPGSVIYGSDALGGVMSFSTHQTKFSNAEMKVGAKGLLRFSTANQETTVGGTVLLSAQKWSSITSVSASKFSDLRMGSKGHPSYEKKYYVINNSKKDSVYNNTDPDIQVGSGYKQYNILQKLAFRIDSNCTIGYNFCYSELSDVPRYDRTIQTKKGQPKYAEWYYGPQKWLMNSLYLKSNQSTKVYDRFKMLISYQNYQESRYKRKLNKDWRSNEKEEVNMLSVNLDFLKKIFDNNTLCYGVETWYNHVGSEGFKNNIYTNEEKLKDSRYPDGATYLSSAIYVTDKYQISGKWYVNTGIRYSYTDACAKFDTTFNKFPYQDMKIQNSAISGNLGLILIPHHSTKISLNYASGFRSPNIDDLSKVFDSDVGSVVVPNIDLEPEYAHSIDLTLEVELWKKTRFLLNGYYTYLDGAMIVSDFQFKKQDSIMYEGVISKVKAVVNKDYAQIFGVQAILDWMFFKNMFFKSSVNYNKGFDSEGEGVRHVPPVFGVTHLVYNNSQWIVDLNIKYNGVITYNNLALSERDKIHMYEINDQGLPYSPSWYTFNLNLSYQLMPNFTIALGFENILDKRYRTYSSGIAAPGRNFIISARLHSF